MKVLASKLSSRFVILMACLMLGSTVVVGCGDDDDSGVTDGGPDGSAGTGSGGTTGGSGGKDGGSGGTTGGSGGASGGSGGTTGGSGGTTGGSGGGNACDDDGGVDGGCDQDAG